jgi:ankyrin repeat protein
MKIQTGETALIMACRKNQLDMVRELVKYPVLKLNMVDEVLVEVKQFSEHFSPIFCSCFCSFVFQ